MSQWKVLELRGDADVELTMSALWGLCKKIAL